MSSIWQIITLGIVFVEAQSHSTQSSSQIFQFQSAMGTQFRCTTGKQLAYCTSSISRIRCFAFKKYQSLYSSCYRNDIYELDLRNVTCKHHSRNHPVILCYQANWVTVLLHQWWQRYTWTTSNSQPLGVTALSPGRFYESAIVYQREDSMNPE